MEKKLNYLIGILILILTWQIAALMINNEIILPTLISVTNRLKVILFTNGTYSIILITIKRLFYGLIISFIFAFVMSFCTNHFETLKEITTPFITILKAIPNVSIIIIVLIWFGSEKAVSVIPMLIIFPIFYEALTTGFDAIEIEYKEMTRIYSSNYLFNYFYIYLPLMKSYLVIACKNALSLGMKVTVMAEVMTQVQIGIGKRIYMEKLNLDMASVIAWTLIIIVLLAVFEFGLNILFRERKIKEDVN